MIPCGPGMHGMMRLGYEQAAKTFRDSLAQPIKAAGQTFGPMMPSRQLNRSGCDYHREIVPPQAEPKEGGWTSASRWQGGPIDAPLANAPVNLLAFPFEDTEPVMAPHPLVVPVHNQEADHGGASDSFSVVGGRLI